MTKNATKEKTPNVYKVSLICPDKTHEVQAESVAEGLRLLNPGVVKGFSLLRVEKDGKKSELRLVPMKVQKLLSSSDWQIIFDKRMNALLK